jgi:hypothetical protein
VKKKEGCTISRTLLQFEYCFSKKGKERKEMERQGNEGKEIKEKEKLFETERLHYKG